jgi:hypothetical protein
MYRKATAKLDRDCRAHAAQCKGLWVKEIKGVTSPIDVLSMKNRV